VFDRAGIEPIAKLRTLSGTLGSLPAAFARRTESRTALPCARSQGTRPRPGPPPPPARSRRRGDRLVSRRWRSAGDLARAARGVCLEESFSARSRAEAAPESHRKPQGLSARSATDSDPRSKASCRFPRPARTVDRSISASARSRAARQALLRLHAPAVRVSRSPVSAVCALHSREYVMKSGAFRASETQTSSRRKQRAACSHDQRLPPRRRARWSGARSARPRPGGSCG
jgi:hypothetical protein